MALKECGACRIMNRTSATRCRCGQVFDPSTIVKKVSRRCPLCGLAEDGGVASCACGYDFSTPASDVRRQLVRRRRYGWIWLGIGLSAVVAAGGLMFFASMLVGVLTAASGAWLIARGASTLSWTRGALAAGQRALPVARVVE